MPRLGIAQRREPADDGLHTLDSSAAAAAAADQARAEPDAAADDDDAPPGAFDPVTGEINWDCPCLGGMAEGPCGEQFKVAFSCFVYSKADPQGIDCVDKFKTMQDCFHDHPDVYGAELGEDVPDDDADVDAAVAHLAPEPLLTPETSRGAPAARPPSDQSIGLERPSVAARDEPAKPPTADTQREKP